MPAKLLMHLKRPVIYIYVILFLLFVYMLSLNSANPMSSDDYPNSFMGGSNEKMSNFFDSIKNTYLLYLGWSGRYFFGLGTYISLYFGKTFFNVINSILFVSLNLLIFFYVKIDLTFRMRDVYKILVIITLCWFGLPIFGQTVMWLTGAVVYLWSTVVILVFLLPYRYLLERTLLLKDTKSNAYYLVIFGGLVGGTLENVTPIIIGFIFLSLLYLKRKQIVVPKWFFTGLIALIGGTAISILSPGNFYRFKVEKQRLIEAGLPLNQNIEGFLNNLWLVMKELNVIFIVLVLVIVIMFLFRRYWGQDKNKKLIMFSGVFVVTGLATWGTMAISPIFPLRSSFTGAVFLIIGLSFLMETSIVKKILDARGVQVLLLFILSVILIPSMFHVHNKYTMLNEKTDERIALINQYLKDGKVDIVVPAYNIRGERHVFSWDISLDKNYAENMKFAAYYGLHSIKASRGNFLFTDTTLSIEYINENSDGLAEVYYDIGRGYNETDYYGEYFVKTKGLNKFNVKIPDEEVKSLRVRIGNTGGLIRINKIMLSTKNKLYEYNLKDLSGKIKPINDILSAEFIGNSLVIEASGKSPTFELTDYQEVNRKFLENIEN